MSQEAERQLLVLSLSRAGKSARWLKVQNSRASDTGEKLRSAGLWAENKASRAGRLRQQRQELIVVVGILFSLSKGVNTGGDGGALLTERRGIKT